MSILTTEDIIEQMVQSAAGNATEQGRHWFRESLRALVRHAKIEQLHQMKKDVQTAIGNSVVKDE